MPTPTPTTRDDLSGVASLCRLRAILDLLPGLPMMDGAIDLEAVDAERAQALGDRLDSLIDTILGGVTALGHLLAVAAKPGMEENALSGETFAGLGQLLAELGDLATWATVMNAQCKHLNADFVSQGAA